MTHHVTRIGTDLALNPERAALTLLRLYERFGGCTAAVARHCGVSTSTVKRWLHLLDQRGHMPRTNIDEIRAEHREERHG